MAGTARFTIADVCSVLDVQKHEVRAWLQLPPYAKAPVKARSARKFTQTDLVFFALIAQLHIDLGISSRAIGKASAALYSLVTSRLEPHKTILINVHRGTAAYLSGSAPSESGVVLTVTPAIERVQNYLLGDLPPVGSADRNVLRLDRTKALWDLPEKTTGTSLPRC